MKLSELIPPVLYELLLKLAERVKLISVKNKEDLRKNILLKNIGKGKRAFMIATGPSIKQEDLSVLAGEDCFSISNFFLHDQLAAVNPSFHFFAPYHEPLVLDNYISWLRQADATLPQKTQMVLCLRDKKMIEENQLFANRAIHYLQFSNSPYFSDKVDLEFPILSPITGPLMMLPVLIYMGYSQIYLIGCDHTVLRDYKREIKHFYDNEKDMRLNASNIDSWHGIIESHQYSLATFLQYNYYKKMINKTYKGVDVINLSQDTWLDLFAMDTLNEVIKYKGLAEESK
ncbi:MAG: hypothetical protein V4590_05490 [Bacteroidota bacterium]